jgi:hypothetical protein
MYDLKRTHSSLQLEKAISLTSPAIPDEGALLVDIIEGGEQKVLLKATAAGTDVISGFAVRAYAQPAQRVLVEELTIPAAIGAATVTFVDLAANNLVSSRIRVLEIGGSAYTPNETYAGDPAGATEVKVDIANGQLKFLASEAAKNIQVTYSYNLTVLESRQFYHQRNINNFQLNEIHDSLTIMKGHGEIYTSMFDSSQDYSVSPTLKLGDGGIITVGGAGPDLPMKVIAVPSVDVPFLGVAFDIL